MSEVDDTIAAARASWQRIAAAEAPMPSRARRRSTQAIGRRLTRMAVAVTAILVAAVAVGLVFPLGIMGALLVMALLVAAVVLFAVWPADRAPPPEKLRTVDLKALPDQTERWLAAQRPALPAPAQHLVDRIGDRLQTLSPQLARVPADSEAALEFRRLIGEQLPAFVADYGRVPQPLRRTERNGRTPDAALADGLAVIDRQIGAMTERLAQDDLDNLQTRGRYLETKYSGG